MRWMRSILLVCLLLLGLAANAESLGVPRGFGGFAKAPVSYGPVVYLPSGVSIEIWNFTDATHPTKSRLDLAADLEAPIFGLAVVGANLYVGWSNGGTYSGYRIYSLADPMHPSHVADAETHYSAALVLRGHFLYEIDGQWGLDVLDVNDPLHPVAVGSGDGLLPTNVQSADVAGNRLYVAGSGLIETSSATIFDLQDPAHPHAIGGINLDAFGRLGAARDDGYVTAFVDGFDVFDARDPSNVTQVFGADTVYASDSVLQGDTLYLLGQDPLQVWDFSTPTPVHLVDSAIDTSNLKYVTPLPFGFLASTQQGAGLAIDTTVRTAPTLAATIDGPPADSFAAAALGDEYVYAIGGNHAFQVIDKQTLEIVGAIDATSEDDYPFMASSDVGLSGSIAIVDGYGALFAVDVANATQPRVVGSLPMGYSGVRFVDGNRVYAYDTDAQAMAIVDISNPAQMSVSGTLPGHHEPLAVGGTLLFTKAYDSSYSLLGVSIVDSSDAAQPAIVGQYIPCAGAEFSAIAAVGNADAIAIACADGTVELVDIGDPSLPVLVATYRESDPNDLIATIAVRGATLYAGTYLGVDQIDLSDIAAPTLAAHYDTASQVYAISLAPAGALLATTGYAGFYIFDCVADEGTSCAAANERAPRGHSHHARIAP